MSNINGSGGVPGGKTLARSRTNQMLAGVCGGLAEYFGVDATLVRAAVVVISIFTAGAGVLAYLAMWVVIPEQGQKTSIVEDLIKQNKPSP